LKTLLRWAAPHQRPSPVSVTRGSSSSATGASSSYSSSQASTIYPSSQASAASSARPSKSQTKAQAEATLQQQEALRKAVELRQMLNNLEKVDDEGRRSSLLDTLCSTDDILNLPAHSNPPGISSGELHVDLLKHQARRVLPYCDGNLPYCRVKHYNGVLNTSTRPYPRRKLTNPFSFGSSGRMVTRCAFFDTIDMCLNARMLAVVLLQQ
jgi:hypothetical protein